nr:hypothetical protein [Tanacetum cinerariifolium]
MKIDKKGGLPRPRTSPRGNLEFYRGIGIVVVLRDGNLLYRRMRKANCLLAGSCMSVTSMINNNSFMDYGRIPRYGHSGSPSEDDSHTILARTGEAESTGRGLNSGHSWNSRSKKSLSSLTIGHECPEVVIVYSRGSEGGGGRRGRLGEIYQKGIPHTNRGAYQKDTSEVPRQPLPSPNDCRPPDPLVCNIHPGPQAQILGAEYNPKSRNSYRENEAEIYARIRSLQSRDYYNLPPQNNPGDYEGLVRDHLDQALNVPHYRNILDMEYFELTVLERMGLLQDRLFNLMLGEQNLSRIMELSPYTNIRREAYDFLEGNSYAPRTEQKAESWLLGIKCPIHSHF